MLMWTATRIAALLDEQDVVYLADDDQQAEALASAVRGLCPGYPVFYLPSSDALPGDSSPASPANVGARISVLRALHITRQQIDDGHFACFMSGEAAARRYPPPEAFGDAPPRLAVGDAIVFEELRAELEDIGYFADDRVDEPGEMAVRGDVIDIFPSDAGMPARIEVTDGKISAIRWYDPVSQRSVDELEGLEIGRASEPLPEGTIPVLEHFRPGALILSPKADKRRRRFLELAADAARKPNGGIDAINENIWSAATAPWRNIVLEGKCDALPRFVESHSPLASLARFAKPLLEERQRVFILMGSQRDLRFLRGRVSKRLSRDLPMLSDWSQIETLESGSGCCMEVAADQGFVDERHVVVAAADLLGTRALIGERPAAGHSPWSADPEIRIGDVVVHEDHGVAIVTGLEPAPVTDGMKGEMIALEYAGGARRLIGTDEANRIWRYGADADAVKLDTLQGSSWANRRGAIEAAIAETAKGLQALAEARDQLQAPIIEPDPAAYERFAGGFPFNETADQFRAIAAVRDDLARGKPMDRLIVGDVGYGKTEVALRAAALAALAGYQVIVAAPTTVLVRQHLEGFQKRFESSGIAVAGLSRLSSPTEKKEVKAGLADGSIKVVIGTAAVMAKGVSYAKLGLVIIDEEQRFGAADKKKLRGAGDHHLLSLSATPIPRTLQMALAGLQQISVIATPPARRQPIRTSLDQYDDARIRTALMREKGRGGQSFVVVPRIEDMAALSARLRRAVPDLVLMEAHGKMAPADIDRVMVGFARGEGDILLATNIIEAGLDVPRANMMIVWNADRFGLAQLHQLRGRVGRGNRRGQVILLTASEKELGSATLKRLRTLAAFDQLGAGFEISARDLDMRGGGDLLGESQAGHMKLIGVDLYQHLLSAALRQARGETVEHWSPELNLGTQGSLPESWIPETDVRLSLYVRLARISGQADLDAFEEELVDRFGPLPEEAETLLRHARLRNAAKAARVSRIDAGSAAIALTPRSDFTVSRSAEKLTAKNDRLLLTEAIPEVEREDRIQALLEDLAA
ncbi:TRCF domain-containing protein [Sphingobium sp. SCG-1]|uniref:TRCF domain-containing protein n=1 Tax=Sphingobium sp. SCG-1 TaxID=2072936 RepID=UPI001CB90B55|nr:TRCF domain-containing protein [Sphingobium sp. SCG-1]